MKTARRKRKGSKSTKFKGRQHHERKRKKAPGEVDLDRKGRSVAKNHLQKKKVREKRASEINKSMLRS